MCSANARKACFFGELTYIFKQRYGKVAEGIDQSEPQIRFRSLDPPMFHMEIIIYSILLRGIEALHFFYHLNNYHNFSVEDLFLQEREGSE